MPSVERLPWVVKRDVRRLHGMDLRSRNIARRRRLMSYFVVALGVVLVLQAIFLTHVILNESASLANPSSSRKLLGFPNLNVPLVDRAREVSERASTRIREILSRGDTSPQVVPKYAELELSHSKPTTIRDEGTAPFRESEWNATPPRSEAKSIPSDRTAPGPSPLAAPSHDGLEPSPSVPSEVQEQITQTSNAPSPTNEPVPVPVIPISNPDGALATRIESSNPPQLDVGPGGQPTPQPLSVHSGYEHDCTGPSTEASPSSPPLQPLEDPTKDINGDNQTPTTSSAPLGQVVVPDTWSAETKAATPADAISAPDVKTEERGNLIERARETSAPLSSSRRQHNDGSDHSVSQSGSDEQFADDSQGRWSFIDRASQRLGLRSKTEHHGDANATSKASQVPIPSRDSHPIQLESPSTILQGTTGDPRPTPAPPTKYFTHEHASASTSLGGRKEGHDGAWMDRDPQLFEDTPLTGEPSQEYPSGPGHGVSEPANIAENQGPALEVWQYQGNPDHIVCRVHIGVRTCRGSLRLPIYMKNFSSHFRRCGLTNVEYELEDTSPSTQENYDLVGLWPLRDHMPHFLTDFMRNMVVFDLAMGLTRRSSVQYFCFNKEGYHCDATNGVPGYSPAVVLHHRLVKRDRDDWVKRFVGLFPPKPDGPKLFYRPDLFAEPEMVEAMERSKIRGSQLDNVCSREVRFRSVLSTAIGVFPTAVIADLMQNFSVFTANGIDYSQVQRCPVRIVVLNRKEDKGRNIPNVGDLMERVIHGARRRALNVTVAEINFDEGADFDFQVASLQHSDILIAVHGAGLTNIPFLHPTSQVIEIMPFGWAAEVFPHISSYFKISHVQVKAVPDASSFASCLERHGSSHPEQKRDRDALVARFVDASERFRTDRQAEKPFLEFVSNVQVEMLRACLRSQILRVDSEEISRLALDSAAAWPCKAQ